MNGLIQFSLAPGVRIGLKNQAFEITFSDANMVRYASCHGGRIQKMPTTTFWELVDDGTIGFLEKSENVPLVEPEAFRHSSLRDNERETMLFRFSLVKKAMANENASRSKKKLAQVIQSYPRKESDPPLPSPSTLARWIQRYVNAGGDPIVLVPRHANKGCRIKKFSYEMENLIARSIRDDYLTLERPTGAQIYCNVIGRALEENLAIEKQHIPSARTLYRRLKELDPYVKALKRHGKRYADMRFRAAGTSTETSRLMEIVMMDGHVMDVIIVDPETGEVLGRPTLVCLFDVHTRAVVGWYSSLLPFCAMTALAAIKDMCSRDPTKEPGGVAEMIVPDNGPDLSSIALRNLCSKLNMHIAPAKSYCPDDKAFVERFFRTLCEQLVHMLPGTTFSSPTQRGNYDSTSHATVTIDQLRQLFKQWVDNTYHQAIHSQTHRAPILAWRDKQSEMPILFLPKEDIDVMARVSHRRKINNGRVIVDDLSYKSDALATWEMRDQRDVVVMVDELNLEFVYVSPVGNPREIVRADCVRANYAKNLTAYEHDHVRKNLAAMAKKDRDELGAYAYEAARYQLWNDIESLPGTHTKRELTRLTEGLGRFKAEKIKTGTVALPDTSQINADSTVSEETVNNPSGQASGIPNSQHSDDQFEVIEI